MPNYTKNAFKGAVHVFTFSMIGALIGYSSRVFLSHKLILEDFGLFFAVFGLAQFLVIFRNLGLETGLIKFISETKALKKFDEMKTYIYVSCGIILSISIIVTAALILMSGYLADNYFKAPNARPIIIIIAIWFFFRGLQDIIFNIFYGFQRMFLYALRELRSILFFIIVVLLFSSGPSVLGPGVFYPAYSWLISCLIIIMIFLPILLRKFKITDYRIVAPKTALRKLVRFSFPVLLNQASQTIISNTDILVLTYFATLSDVGLYSVILPTSLLLFRVSTILITVAFPISSELWARNKIDALKSGILMMYKYMLLVIVPASFVLISNSAVFLGLLFGDEYSIGATAFRLILFGVIIGSIAQVNNSIITSIGKPANVTKVILSVSLVNIFANIILVPIYGINGAAAATLVSYALMFILSTREITRLVGFNAPWGEWLKTLIGGVILMVSVFVLREIISMAVIPEVLIVAMISGALFIVYVFMTRIVTVTEIRGIIRRVF